MGAPGLLRHSRRILAALSGCLLGAAAPLAAQDDTVSPFVYSLAHLVPDSFAQHNGLTVFPILSLPFGGDQNAMATAYTAVARDLSYLESNPAAGVLLDQTQAAVNTANVIYSIGLQTAGWTERWGDFSLGAFAKIMSSDFNGIGSMGDTFASSYYMEGVLGLNASLTLLRDYNFSGIALGASVKLAYRDIPKEIYSRITKLDGIDQNAVGVMGDLGALIRFNFLKAYSSRDKNFSVGVAIKNLGPPANGEPLPTTLSAGISYQLVRPWTLSADFNLPINLMDPASSSDPGFAVGTALQIANFAAFKGGFLLKGGNPRFTVGGEFTMIEWATFTFAYTLDLSTRFKIGDHMSLQAKINFGDNGRAAASRKVDELYIAALVASSESDWAKVISLCEELLALDPGFVPAKDVLAQAKSSQVLAQQIESIRIEGQAAK